LLLIRKASQKDNLRSNGVLKKTLNNLFSTSAIDAKNLWHVKNFKKAKGWWIQNYWGLFSKAHKKACSGTSGIIPTYLHVGLLFSSVLPLCYEEKP